MLAEMRQHSAAGKIGTRKARTTLLMAVPSNPCFEFWLLLHFHVTTASFTGPDDVIARLRRCEGMAAYCKNQIGLFNLLRPRLQAAITNAQQVRQQAEANGANEPLTYFDQLIEYLLLQAERHVPQR